MIKVYECYGLMDENGKCEKDIVLELWYNSTRHSDIRTFRYPDCRFYFNEFEKTPYFDEKYQIFQWLLECAKLVHPFFAKEIVEYALKNYTD